uniref:Alternative protein TRIM67 n=1 Tax=Homo sapiens TaxID=9606 RepID=L8E9I3_HUMAN|nr:alternative protein TRIM67 [Homo sapiens]
MSACLALAPSRCRPRTVSSTCPSRSCFPGDRGCRRAPPPLPLWSTTLRLARPAAVQAGVQLAASAAVREVAETTRTSSACTARQTAATGPTPRASSPPTGFACCPWCPHHPAPRLRRLGVPPAPRCPRLRAPSRARSATAAHPWTTAACAASSATGCSRPSCSGTSRAAGPCRGRLQPRRWPSASCATAPRQSQQPRSASSATSSTALPASSSAIHPGDPSPSIAWCSRRRRRRRPPRQPPGPLAPPRAPPAEAAAARAREARGRGRLGAARPASSPRVPSMKWRTTACTA